MNNTEITTASNIATRPYDIWDNKGKWHKDYMCKIKIARNLGYTYLSEAICKLYILNEYSIYDIGNLFDIRPSAVHYRLRQWKVPLRSRGGGRHFDKTFPVAGALVDLKKNWKGGVHALYREASSRYGLSFHTVKNFYVKGLWKDIINEKRD